MAVGVVYNVTNYGESISFFDYIININSITWLMSITYSNGERTLFF